MWQLSRAIRTNYVYDEYYDLLDYILVLAEVSFQMIK